MYDDQMFGGRGSVQHEMAQLRKQVEELKTELCVEKNKNEALESKNMTLLKLCMEIEEKYLSIERMRKEL